MERPRLKRTTVICFILLVAAVAFFVQAYDPLGAKVHHILVADMVPSNGNKWDAGMNELWQLGPGIIPHLAAETTARDTALSRKYAALWTNSPIWLKNHLPRPVNRADLRQSAMLAISEFGPLAARRSAPQVIAALKEKDFYHQNFSFWCLRWLVPDSKAATEALKYGLSGSNTNWPRPEDFLNIDDSVWPKVPEVVPLLTNLLHNSGHAYQAAIALGRVGSNAAPVIPALIDTVDIGAAGFTDAKAVRHNAARHYVAEVYSNPLGVHLATVIADDKQMNHNRAMAALALGRIGIATPEVCAALARAWNSPDPWVRHNAALAVAMLGPPMTNQLPALLSGLKDNDNTALDSKLQAIGKLGSGVVEALPILRELTQTNLLTSIVTNANPQIAGGSIRDLSVSAKTAICRINPEEGRPFLSDIATNGRTWETVVFLTEPSPFSNDIVRVAEPMLDDRDVFDKIRGAYIILSHDRQHVKALDVLRHAKTSGDINDRLFAGRVFYLATGDTNGLCDIISEALQDTRSFIGQNACEDADKMGTNALPALPALKAALWHKDRFVRERAGALVIKLAPQDLPINEPK